MPAMDLINDIKKKEVNKKEATLKDVLDELKSRMDIGCLCCKKSIYGKCDDTAKEIEKLVGIDEVK